jgi:hypothetical protein
VAGDLVLAARAVHGSQRWQILVGAYSSWHRRAIAAAAMRGWAQRARGGVFLFLLFLID